MSGRILEMRQGLRDRLEKRGTPGSWDHITSQIGMFSFTGLSEEQVLTLRSKWHVYMVCFDSYWWSRYMFGIAVANSLFFPTCRRRTAASPWPA